MDLISYGFHVTLLERDLMMPVNTNEIIRKLSSVDRKKVEDRAAEIIAEELSLRDLRVTRLH
ncbi:MAG: hypothetical protein WCE61_14890 [Candidatus Acidiferrum sp.]